MCMHCLANTDFITANAVVMVGAGSTWFRRFRLSRRPVTDDEVETFLARLDDADSRPDDKRRQ
ncbi:MAG: hypothetical protein ACRD0U_06930 [Acidimicrobiales bacterium]